MPPPEIGRPAALGERERAEGRDVRKQFDLLSGATKKRNADRLSADEWRMLINMRLGSAKRLMDDRKRKGTLTNVHADLLRKEMTWARIHRGDKPEAVMRWLVVSLPMYPSALLAAMTPDARAEARERQTAAFCALINWARKRKNWLRPLAMGNRLEVTPEEREALKLRTIRYAGQTDDIMAMEQRRRNRERKAASRRAEGKPTRAEWRAGCLTATKPWRAENISRSTWERRQKKAAIQPVREVTQVVPQYKGYIPSSYIADTLASPETGDASTVQGRALDGAPPLGLKRVRSVAVVTSRPGWTRQSAMLTPARAEAVDGDQSVPFRMFSDGGRRDFRPMGMAARVLPPAQGAGARPREMSACNIFLQGSA